MRKKTKMRLLSILLCFVMLVGLMPTTALAAEETTVTTYSELWSAIYSNNDYCITLGSDITYEVPDGGNTPLSPWQYLLNVDGTKNKTIDLNGHTLQVSNEKTSWPTQSGLFNIDDTASLTVKNGTIKLYNYNNSNRTDMGVFNARGGNLMLTNVNVLNGREGTAVNAEGDATVNIEGGTISAFNGFAVTAVGTSWLTLDKNVVLTTTTGNGLITQPADNGYGSLHASTSNLTVVSAMFEAGIEVEESTIGQFSASANRLVFVGGQQHNAAFATSKSGDYYWDTDATGGCALVVNDNGYSFASNVNVISTTAKQAVTVTNGTASTKQAAYSTTVTITANDIPGKVFSGWTVESGGVTLADSSAKTTTFTMGAKAVEIRANYDNAPISSARFTVATPVQGEHPSVATTTTEHITVSETWYAEKYDENSFSSTLPQDYTFEVGHTYRVGVVFEVEQGYVLDNNFSVKFADPISSTETPASQGATPYVWIVDYTVENNGVEITSVTATVSGVEAGATAGSSTVTTNDTTYTVSIKGWYDCDNVFSYESASVLQATDTFVGGKTYTVGVTFTPIGGNTLSNSLTTSINGESGKIGGWDSGSRNYFITITIPATQPTEYIVSYDANGGSGTMVGDMVEENGKFTLENCTYIAPEGYKFKAWAIGSVNGEQKQPGEQITITGETYIYAIWESIAVSNYIITATAGENGNITPSGEVSVAKGSSKTFTITADSGYHIKDVKLNGTSIGVVSVYTFENVSDNATISVEFDVDTVLHTCNPNPVPKVEPNCTTAGKSAYYHCECGKNYEDAQGNTEIADIETWGILNPLDHDYASAWSSDASGHWKICARCSEKQNVSSHTVGDWIVDKEATETVPGSKHKECSVCGYKLETAEIPKTGKQEEATPVPAAKGKVITDEQGSSYKVTKSDAKDGEVTFTKPKSGASGTVKIPDTVTIDGITYKVTAIEANAFKNNKKKITKVIIGNNVKVIGKNAFAGCKKLNSVTVGKNVKTISAGAFSGCAKLKTVKLGAAVTTIGDKAFYKCTSLTSITIPAKVTKIGKSAFEGCKKLKTITVKSTKLKSVGKKALKGIHAKAKIKVPKSKLAKYKRLFKNKGQGKNVKVTK